MTIAQEWWWFAFKSSREFLHPWDGKNFWHPWDEDNFGMGRIFATPEMGRIFATPEMGRIFGTPGMGRIFGTPEMGRIVATPEMGRIFAPLRWGEFLPPLRWREFFSYFTYCCISAIGVSALTFIEKTEASSCFVINEGILIFKRYHQYDNGIAMILCWNTLIQNGYIAIISNG